jgi:hypothetical protein
MEQEEIDRIVDMHRYHARSQATGSNRLWSLWLLQSMLGSFDASMPGAVHSTSQMTSILAGYNARQYPLVQSAMAFNTQYRCEEAQFDTKAPCDPSHAHSLAHTALVKHEKLSFHADLHEGVTLTHLTAFSQPATLV